MGVAGCLLLTEAAFASLDAVVASFFGSLPVGAWSVPAVQAVPENERTAVATVIILIALITPDMILPFLKSKSFKAMSHAQTLYSTPFGESTLDCLKRSHTILFG